MTNDETHRQSYDELRRILQRLQSYGVAPNTVVDVGAAYGEWTATCAAVFPKAHYVMLEPQPEFTDFLSNVDQRLESSTYRAAAAASDSGELRLFVHHDLTGTSRFVEAEGSALHAGELVVPSVTVDSLVTECKPPYFLKVDVQGAELDVLAGAEQTLKNTELVVLELSFFQFFQGGPLAGDVIRTMDELGFVMYDVLDLLRRPYDHALAQADAAFVRRDSALRTSHIYATPDQRREQHRAFNELHERRRAVLESSVQPNT